MLLWLGEDRFVEAVESAGQLTGELQMGKLIFAHGNIVGLVEEDVGGLKDRITEEPIRGEVSIG
jgi:hypothetical protein